MGRNTITTLVRTNRQFQQLVLDTVPECTSVNAAFFFADPDDPEEEFGRSERAIAISACKRCPIKNECFRYAIDNDIQHGVFGASIPAQREAYRRKVEGAARQATAQEDH